MSDQKAVRILHSALKHRDKWYIDLFAPEGMEDYGEKAKLYADKKLSAMSSIQLWWAFRKWEKSDAIMRPEEDYFIVFLNDLCFNLGKSALRGTDRLLFEDSCSLTVNFIKK